MIPLPTMSSLRSLRRASLCLSKPVRRRRRAAAAAAAAPSSPTNCKREESSSSACSEVDSNEGHVSPRGSVAASGGSSSSVSSSKNKTVSFYDRVAVILVPVREEVNSSAVWWSPSDLAAIRTVFYQEVEARAGQAMGAESAAARAAAATSACLRRHSQHHPETAAPLPDTLRWFASCANLNPVLRSL
jgi:hypothetical protein